MLLVFSIFLLIVISAVIILDYKKTEDKHKLIALPITAYFLLGLYLLEKLPIHQGIIYFFTLVMLIISFRFAYIEIKNAE